MKCMLTRALFVTLALIFLFSCDEEHPCDTNDYAQPEIVILEPADGDIVFPLGWNPPTVSLHLKAEAGLNTLKVVYPWDSHYEQPIHVFTNGETDLVFTFEFTDTYEGELIFRLYDRCNQFGDVEAQVSFEQASAG